jgi:uncharacterized OB-fold protein
VSDDRDLQLRTPDRPLPKPDDVTSTYWDGCARGELLIQHCPKCGHRQFYPRAMCTVCASTPEWERASGRGTVHTFTVIRQNHAKPFRDLLPYVVAMIELDEGPRMMGNLVGCPVEDVAVGMPVEVFFDAADDELSLPFWRPAAP